MEKTFKKMTIGFFSLFLVSIMLVSAGVYPIPFTNNNQANVAVVYGANAASTDSTAADSLVNSLANGIDIIPWELERIFSDGFTEDEVKLGSDLKDETRSRFTDNKLPSLFDGKIYWDDGDDTDSYNVHEEITIGDVKILTTLDNNDFEGVVLTNNEGLEYKLIFEENMPIEKLGSDDADALELTILGEDYLIEEVGTRSITVTNAEKALLPEGTSTTIDGITLTVDNIYTGSVIINGVVIKEGRKAKINGLEVKVEEIYSSSKDSVVSKVEIYAGGDISEEYSDGDAFIGEDDDDPEWVWSISNPGKDGGWIGVKYDLRQSNEDDDVVYEGDEYVFPNGFAAVSFDGLTDVEYYDYDVYFDEVDLYEIGSKGTNGVHSNDSPVVVISGENDDSFELDNYVETDTLYLVKSGSDVSVYYMDLDEDFSTGKPVYYDTIALSAVTKSLELTTKNTTSWEVVGDVSATITYTPNGNELVISGILEGYTLVYYPNTVGDDFDINIANTIVLSEGANDVSNLPIDIDVGDNYCGNGFNPDATLCDGAKLWLIPGTESEAMAKLSAWKNPDTWLFETDLITYTKGVIPFNDTIATLVADDTELDVKITGTENITLSIGNIEISLREDNNGFIKLGEEYEDAESNDVKVNGKSIGTYDNDVMDYYGTIIESPESNADDDKVVFRIPSEQVYAQVSVLGSEEDTVAVNATAPKPTPAELNISKITDGGIAAASGKNIIVVGGSCINTLAESLLGGKFCGADFTANTGVSAGQVLIKTFDRGNGKVATLVAGYNAEDTARGVQYLLNNNVNIAVGESVIV